MTITNDKEPQYPPPANADNLFEQPLPPPHMNSNHREEPPFTPLPPPFHELRSYKEILICLTHLFHHLRLNHHNASCPGCDDESLLTLNPNANVYSEQPADNFDSDMAVYYRLPPPPQPVYHGGHHSLPQNPTNYLDNKPTFRVYTKAKTDYSLTIRNGKVILAPTNSSDLHQHWIKDEKFGSSIKDEKGNPAFALVNKATGEAMKFSIGVTYPVQLKKYNPNEVDMTVLWSESNDLGDGYRSFRTVTNIHLNLDACKGVKEHGGVQDGTEIILWEWNDGENQKWIIFPYCKSFAQTYTQ